MHVRLNIVLAGLVVVLVFSVATKPARADTVSNRTIETLHVNTTGGVYFETYESMVNPDTCTYDPLDRVDVDSPFLRDVYALLLAARTANTKITFSPTVARASTPRRLDTVG